MGHFSTRKVAKNLCLSVEVLIKTFLEFVTIVTLLPFSVKTGSFQLQWEIQRTIHNTTTTTNNNNN